ncbi:hypothetical protein Fot_19493 [Forsythia ovata]|uniref:Secreted protein n=1 Tax=Forsythia ovata TaxID=205694 RepID=A0ABD1VLK8_9LAMI
MLDLVALALLDVLAPIHSASSVSLALTKSLTKPFTYARGCPLVPSSFMMTFFPLSLGTSSYEDEEEGSVGDVNVDNGLLAGDEGHEDGLKERGTPTRTSVVVLIEPRV